MRHFLLMLLMTLAPFLAAAEPVEIHASFGKRGQGWLFGSARDGRCWIALPRHVAGPEEEPQLLPFVFADRQGRSGQSLDPIPVAAVPGAVEAAAGHSDLAFAPVAPGARAPGGCNSRLGLAPRLYAIMLQKTGQLGLITLQGGSAAMFTVRITRLSNDADEGALMLLRASDPSDDGYLIGGLSGSVALMLHEGQPHPGAMVLKVNKTNATATALRFDRIASAFDMVEAHLAGSAPPTEVADVRAALGGLLGQLEPGAAPLERITGTGGCWRLGLVPGKQRVELMLAVPQGQRVEWLQASLPEDCGAPSAALLDIRWPGAGWQMLTGRCHVTYPDAVEPCRVGRTGPFDLRLRIDGDAAIGRISLE